MDWCRCRRVLSVPSTELTPARRRALGRRIREAREAVGLTQAELAEKSGLARSYLSAVENGARNISSDALWSLADVFGATPAVFYLGAREDTSS